jgi:hypothetical protein
MDIHFVRLYWQGTRKGNRTHGAFLQPKGARKEESKEKNDRKKKLKKRKEGNNKIIAGRKKKVERTTSFGVRTRFDFYARFFFYTGLLFGRLWE